MYHNATKLYKIMLKGSTGVRTKANHNVNDGEAHFSAVLSASTTLLDMLDI